MTLRLAEELTLLMLHDENGVFLRVPQWSMQCVFVGAVLMDLALENRIDSDPRRLVLLDRTPIGDELLDPTLAEIAREREPHDVRYWMEALFDQADDIQASALDRLVARGILRQQDDVFLWVIKSRRYPLVDGEVARDMKGRIMGVLYSDEIPDPRDIGIICLLGACGIFRALLSDRELIAISERIQQVSKLDLVGRVISDAVRDIESSLTESSHPTF